MGKKQKGINKPYSELRDLDLTSEEFKMTFEKYKMVVNARNFHYDNFNKWMTYFYVAIAALFVAYTSIPGVEGGILDLKVPILILSYLISLFFYWAAKGYYYWSIHWIKLVYHYEMRMGWTINDLVYKVFWDKNKKNNFINPISGANFSTSKITLLFAFIICGAWGTMLILTLLKILNVACAQWLLILMSSSFSICTTITITWIAGLTTLKSDLTDMEDMSEHTTKKYAKIL